MRTTLLVASILATALAAPTSLLTPLRAREYNSPWQAALDTKSVCDHDTDKVIGLYVGPQVEEVVENACVALMPGCAHADRLNDETMCPQVMDWQLDGAKSSTQPANVEMIGGDKVPGWDVKCKLCAGEMVQVTFADSLPQFPSHHPHKTRLTRPLSSGQSMTAMATFCSCCRSTSPRVAIARRVSVSEASLLAETALWPGQSSQPRLWRLSRGAVALSF
jgi:hypothetical protein